MALLFRPFVTEYVYSDERPFGLRSDPVVLVMPEPYEGIDEIHVYLGHRTGTELNNFKCFVQIHNLEEKGHGIPAVWEYSCIFAVGWNFLAGVPVDIPWYMFPWSPPLFTHLEAPSLFDRPVPPLPEHIEHQLVSTCRKCSYQKVACGQIPGWQCAHCDYLQCTPSPNEDFARAEACYGVAALVFSALSAPYQHLIQCVKTKAGFGRGIKMRNNLRSQLTALVQASYLGGDEGAGNMIVERADAYQKVVFHSGELRIIKSENMQGMGFRGPPYHSKAFAATSCTPHLGLADYRVALTLVDNALEKPGIVHWKEDCIWTGSGFVSVRIFIAARIPDADTMYFVLGFKFQ